MLVRSKQYPVIAIVGPRQSGKTTLAQTVFLHKKYISLEDYDNREFALDDPRAFLEGIKDGAILDEIQRAPQLLNLSSIGNSIGVIHNTVIPWKDWPAKLKV